MTASDNTLCSDHREVGGCMLPVWPQYFESARSLIYVIDISTADVLAAAVTELHTLLQHPSIQVMLLTSHTTTTRHSLCAMYISMVQTMLCCLA